MNILKCMQVKCKSKIFKIRINSGENISLTKIPILKAGGSNPSGRANEKPHETAIFGYFVRFFFVSNGRKIAVNNAF